MMLSETVLGTAIIPTGSGKDCLLFQLEVIARTISNEILFLSKFLPIVTLRDLNP